MTAHRVFSDLGQAIQQGWNNITAPISGGTFNQGDIAYGTAVVGAGTFKLPNGGVPMYVQAAGVAEIQDASGAVVCILASGRVALVIPTSSTTWVHVPFDTVSSASLSVAKFTTSATTTSITPAAGALTGAQNVFWENTADGTLALTTRTGDQLLADLMGVLPAGAAIGTITYLLTIVNRGNNTITITAGDGVTISGEATIATLVTRTYFVEVTSSGVTMTSVAKGTIET